MNILTFILEYWDVILSLILIVIGTVVKLKKLWKGNFVEWLIAICDEMENQYGAGMGLLKHANAYNKFVEKFPIVSKFISQETFDGWVKEALEQLDSLIDKDGEEEEYEIEETLPQMPEEIIEPIPETIESTISIDEETVKVVLPQQEIPKLKLEKINTDKIKNLKIISPLQKPLEMQLDFSKISEVEEGCNVQIKAVE